MMSVAHSVAEKTEIGWTPVSGIQPVVYVAKIDGKPVAILELRPGAGFRLTTCRGEMVGDYASVEAGEAALEIWLDERSEVIA